MAKGDIPNPWFYDSGPDVNGAHITINIPWNATTHAILNGGVIHRDPGCVWTHIVWDNPTDAQKAKRSPVVPDGDTTFTATQIRQFSGFQTLEDLRAVQVTAET